MISSNSVHLNYIIRVCIACILTSMFSPNYFISFLLNLHCFVAFNFMLFFSASVENTIVLTSSLKKTTTLKMLRKWESEFSIKLEFDTNSDSKIYHIKCCDCKKWETRINSMKNFLKS